MIAFHGKKEIKAKYLKRVRAHQKADEIVKGQYWTEGKGCAVGCTIHSSSHNAYETELGIPEWLARVEDVIFEGLPNDRAQKWPSQFLNAIKVGADVNKVEAPFVIFILESLFSTFDTEKYLDVKKAIEGCIELYKEGDLAPSDRWNAARNAARNAAESAARNAARNAAESAARNAAESAARNAAESAARNAAENAARNAAWSAAESAAWNAARNAAESAAWNAAWSAAYVKFADKLLELLRAA
jgi:hypothetical protein